MTPEAIKVTAERIVQRLEDATPGSLFYCEADREEAVEIACAEITILAQLQSSLAPATETSGA